MPDVNRNLREHIYNNKYGLARIIGWLFPSELSIHWDRK